MAAWVTASRDGEEESTVFRAVALETGDRPPAGRANARSLDARHIRFEIKRARLSTWLKAGIYAARRTRGTPLWRC